jgi:hypothetical protein
MTRYKGRAKISLNERNYPHHVELQVPEGGFGKRLDEIHDWHRARGIQAMGGFHARPKKKPPRCATALT